MEASTSKATPIQRQLMRAMLLTSGLALLLTITGFFVYEYVTFRQTLTSQLTILGQIIAANSTAALAFDSVEDAEETLGALQANPHIVAAGLYDEKGRLFATYPANAAKDQIPGFAADQAYQFTGNFLEGFQPVVQNGTRLGSLYLKSDMDAMYERFTRYGLIVLMVLVVSLGLTYLLSRRLREAIARPILALAQAATLVSREHNYTVRATKYREDEIGLLTDAFNHMLTQIDQQNTEILAWNQQLEEKIKARTQELEQTNSKLMKSNRDLEQFAYVASHDLQEPLRKIQTFAQLAESNANDPSLTQQYLNKIYASAERMGSLIKSVLHYSRLSNASEPFSPVDLNAVIEHIQSDFELLMQEKQATVIANGLPVVQGIPLQINQLFSNLIHNALKFSDKPPCITITARTQTDTYLSFPDELAAGRNYVELVVTDNGIGFNEQYARKVFTIFQRLHNQKEYPGTGIGLALCKKIVENHSGAITVHSEVGKGTTFFVYLPLN